MRKAQKKKPAKPESTRRWTLVPYSIGLVLLVGGAFAAVTTQWNEKTVFATVRDTVTSAWSRTPGKAPKKKSAPKHAVKTMVQRDPKAKARVALLREASREVAERAEKTRVDPAISPAQKKDLDDLVTSRVRRDR